MPPLNECGACGVDFTSLRLFDAHRVGVHAYDFSDEHTDGRRCISVDEMLERGWVQDDKGRWFDPEAVEAARKRFGGGTTLPFSAVQVDGEATRASAGVTEPVSV